VVSFLRKALVGCGLVGLTGPLCFTVLAQGYVDLEAERAAAIAAGRDPNAPSSQTTSSGTASSDPYGARPAQAYPATSYGVNNAPAAPSTGAATAQTSNQNSTQTTSAGGQMAGSDLGSLFQQIQQLQQEVMQLNGKVEEQAFHINQLK
jgi:hypothetical protein